MSTNRGPSTTKNILELLRAELSKTERGDREEAAIFEVASGMAFLSALMSDYPPAVLPLGQTEPLLHSVNICQIGTRGDGKLSLQHIVTALQISGIEVHGQKTSEAMPAYRHGCSTGSWARQIQVLPSLLLDECHQQPPVLTATYAQLSKILHSPLSSVEDWTNASIVCAHPAFKDFSSLVFLANRLTEQTGSWMEDAALIRALLIADACVTPKHLVADPIWAKVACDGVVVSIEQEPVAADPGPFNDVSISICAVPMDTWVGIRTGAYLCPEGWGPNSWGGEVAVVPVETCCLDDPATWLYVLSFVTTRLWNGLHLYKAIIKPNKELSSASTTTEHIVVKFKPLATNVVVDGPTRILLVLTNLTSQLNSKETRITDVKIPIWRPSKEAMFPADVTEILRQQAGTRAATNNVEGLWRFAWQYLMRYTATEASVQRAIYLVAETVRNLDLGFASNPAKAFPVYSIHLKSGFLPNLPDVNFDVKNWEDPNMNIQEAITNINAHNVYPHGF
ncbi:unnamed protein product, partial [Gongylonema pulchrum]|uniref:DNA helicase n=1 Tax=Gongylonema pulchrum TaxID=637853 RepID=A0A183EQ30_9BILA